MVTRQQKKPTLMFIVLMLIFIVPMLAAWLSYSNGLFLSGKQVNHGELLRPPFILRDLDLKGKMGGVGEQELKGKWVLMYLTDAPQGELSQRNLYYIRQIRQATGKNRDRVERALVTLQTTPDLEDWIKKNYPGLHHFTISHPKAEQLQSRLPKKLALESGSIYLVDPLGNIMLFFSPDSPPKGILKDLERVLKVSQIG